MKCNSKQVSKILLCAAFAAAVVAVPAAEEKSAAPAEAEAPAPEPPKKKVKKDAEYAVWDKAAAVSEALDQPILGFIEVRGDRICSKVRMMTVGNPAFKDFIKDNCVYYHYSIPQVEQKQTPGQRKAKDAPAQPNYQAIKKTETAAVSKLCGGNKTSAFPVIAVVAPGGGRLLGSISLMPEEASFDKFIEELKQAFEAGKHEVVLSKKIQKVLADEAKKRAALEKRAKK